ncbi:Increased DNA methylation 1, partial [Bienertia sinuspersici]
MQVVTPNQFELHAGSLNKRPADYIYLENGKSLRNIISECNNANLKSRSIECRISCSQVEASHTTPIEKGVDANKRSVEVVSLQKSSYNASNSSLQSTKSQGKITRKDLRLHKLVFQNDFLPDGTELGYYVQGKKLLSGYKQGFGIFCYCCKTEISPSQFEAHAGFASRRKPYLNIYTSNGASLHELSLTLSRTSQFSTDENDDLCSVCHGLGNLLCCDGCPRAFHIECISLTSIPQNKWYCNYCEDMFQKEKFAERNPNAIAAGRVPGVDPVEQITNRCIRIVKTLDSQDSSGCALCRVHDFCKSGFGPRTVIICDQCEKEFHVGCLKGHKMQYLKELPVGDWFCCPDCEGINCALKEAVEAGEKKLPDSLMDVLKKKFIEKDSSVINLDVTWRVFNGRKSYLDEIRPLLSKAVSVFHEQFDPICYGEHKQDLIPHMVYGRNLKEKEFGGMYCAVISVNSTIVSCAVFRVFGKDVVEVPLVATCKDCEGKGYFQCLYFCMERFFEELGVKNIVLPAAEETGSLWMNKFGFSVMLQEKLNDLRRRYALMNFAGTSVLHKL